MPPFYYYRDRDGKEIDLLILRDGTLYPLEIKKTALTQQKPRPTFPRSKKIEHTHRTGRRHLPDRTTITTHRNSHVDSRIRYLDGQAGRHERFTTGRSPDPFHRTAPTKH